MLIFIPWFFNLDTIIFNNCLISGYEFALVPSIGLVIHQSMLFHVTCQSVCPRGRIITLIAFVWLFPTVCIQMSPQIPCLRGCKITLVAFVWHFSTVCFQMSPHIACREGCKVTLVAFVWLLSYLGLSHKSFYFIFNMMQVILFNILIPSCF